MKFMLDPAVHFQDILLRSAAPYPSPMFSGALPNVNVAQPRKLTWDGQTDSVFVEIGKHVRLRYGSIDDRSLGNTKLYA